MCLMAPLEERLSPSTILPAKDSKYRILVAPDAQDTTWPDAIRIGSGASGFALLKDVPIWYELWRQINGFPPDYYLDNERANQTGKKDEK
jgi:adhesin transport system membrane fusion protein